MTRLAPMFAALLFACHDGYLSPVEGSEGERDSPRDTDVDTGEACDLRLLEGGGQEVPVGAIQPPTTLCGSLTSLSNDGETYTGDIDWTAFTATSGQEWSFTLTWDEATANVDLFLLDAAGDALEASLQEGPAQPEQVAAALTEGAGYGLVVVGWSGQPTAYAVAVEQVAGRAGDVRL
jgi:hypothetical protein